MFVARVLHRGNNRSTDNIEQKGFRTLQIQNLTEKFMAWLGKIDSKSWTAQVALDSLESLDVFISLRIERKWESISSNPP
jgi:hypothetical protein